MRPVGILGGMGPEATILLMQKVLAAVPATDDAGHVPLIVHQNPQVPSRIAHLIEGKGASPAPVLAGMARDLEAAGAAALAMPCNTAHAYLPAIRAATALPVLDMVAASAARLAARTPGARVGMLASPATRRARVFDSAFAAAGLVPVWAEDEAALLALIRTVKAGGRPGAGLAREAAALAGQGAEALCIACTELSLLADALPAGLPVLDTLDALTAQIVAFANVNG
ncbi:MAG: aspartate racemase [Alphaproteobacteria bacterium HGW-Alphaproteobacteria-2]|nr:MAG: aspartate racemase [Alphaproteobacteria bacterium HGW-Alphaproteobacteria-2]